MSKRIKSGLITLVSIFGAVMMSPEFVDFTKFTSDKLTDWGVPVAVIGVMGVLLSEIWKQVLNWHTMRKLEKSGLSGSSPDYNNELY